MNNLISFDIESHHSLKKLQMIEKIRFEFGTPDSFKMATIDLKYQKN